MSLHEIFRETAKIVLLVLLLMTFINNSKVIYGADSNIVINFDTFPDGSPVPEGTVITNQYADLGAIFSVSDALEPPAFLIIEDASGGFFSPADFPGMSLPNMLTRGGFSPGPTTSVGCNYDVKVDFVDPVTHIPTTVTSASIMVFANAEPFPATIRLIARNSSGAIVDQDEFEITFLPLPGNFPASTLSVSAPEIASIETDGVTGNDICTIFDNLEISIPEAVLLSKSQRLFEFLVIYVTTELAIATVITVAGCTLAAPACAPLIFALNAIVGPYAAFQLWGIISDPPDPDFSVIFLPRNYTPHTIEPAGILPEEVEALANLTIAKLVDLYELTEAWRVSLERYNAAIAANDTDAAAAQLAALEGYIRDASVAAASAKKSLNQLINGVEPLIGPLQITQNDVEMFLADLAQNGFGPEEQEIFDNLGLSQEDIDRMKIVYLEVDPTEVPTDIFPALRRLAVTLGEMAEFSSCVDDFCIAFIDIKPGNNPNSINPKSDGKIPVAILSNSKFDATTVNINTALFGVTGNEATPYKSALEDVNEDGKTDIILHFITQDTGVKCGDKEAKITGETLSGTTFEGTDSINTVSCK